MVVLRGGAFSYGRGTPVQATVDGGVVSKRLHEREAGLEKRLQAREADQARLRTLFEVRFTESRFT